jgi:hypothetical protein
VGMDMDMDADLAFGGVIRRQDTAFLDNFEIHMRRVSVLGDLSCHFHSGHIVDFLILFFNLF